MYVKIVIKSSSGFYCFKTGYWTLVLIGTFRWTFRTLILFKTPKFSKTIPYIRHDGIFRNPIARLREKLRTLFNAAI